MNDARKNGTRRRTTLHTRDVPVDLKAQFKAYCARRGYTMEAAVIALMRKAAQDDMPLPEARRRSNIRKGAQQHA